MAMSPKDKAKFQAEWKKPGNVKKNEVISPGAVVRGVASAAAKAVAKKRVPATYTPTKKAVPAKVVKKTTPPIVKEPSLENLLKQNYAKALKITKARNGDPKSVSVTIDGKTIDYKGIR